MNFPQHAYQTYRGFPLILRYEAKVDITHIRYNRSGKLC